MEKIRSNFIKTLLKASEILTRILLGLTSIIIIFLLSYLMGGHAYLNGSWGTDTRSYIAMLAWYDKFFPTVPFWYPLAGGGVSITHAYPALSFYFVSLIKHVFGLNLFSSLSILGYATIISIAVSIYFFVSFRFKNQTAALIASICYLISPISWTWLTDWGFYAESISHMFIVPAIFFWDLYFNNFINRIFDFKTRLWLFLTILFATLTMGTHFLSGYALMGIYYAYVFVYFLLSSDNRKKTLFLGTLALFIVGVLSLTATMTFSVPFSRYAKFALDGGTGPASPPTIKDYQEVLPTIKNVIGYEDMVPGTFSYGMKMFKFPLMVTILSFAGVVFYNWKDKRKWTFSVYGMWGLLVALLPAYYVYFLNKFPIGFIAGSFGWRPMYALVRIVIPILAGLGISGISSLPFIFIKNDKFKITKNILISLVSLFLFFGIFYWQVNYTKIYTPLSYGSKGLDKRNLWGEFKDACPGYDNKITNGMTKEELSKKYEEFGGYERWCNSNMNNYFAPLAVADWCLYQKKSGKTELPKVCNPDEISLQNIESSWKECRDNLKSNDYCQFSYPTIKEQLNLGNWPKLNVMSGYEPNAGLNTTLATLEKDNPNARIDFSPYMGGDSMMAPFYNINRNLSQIHIYVASASLVHRLQGFQQIVYYLNSPMYDDVNLLNDITKWFGINYVFDVPNVYSTSEENLFKRAGWELFSGNWGNGIYKFTEKNELAELTAKKSVLVIGQKKYSVYDQVFSVSMLGTLPYDKYMLIWGKDNIDDYNLSELKKFSTLLLQGFTYRNKNKADSLLKKYVEEGGSVFIDTGWQYKNPEWQTNNPLSIIPFTKLSWKDLGKANDYTKNDSGIINADVNTDGFGPLVYNDSSWAVSTGGQSDLKNWAKTEISISGNPIVVSGVIGKGKIVWSGMNIISHVKQKETVYPDEIKILKNSFDWLTGNSTTKNYDLTYSRDNPDSITFNVPKTTESTFLLWKEGYYPDFKANLISNDSIKSLNILRAGPGWFLIEVPELKNDSKINLFYKKPFAEIGANIISILTFIFLGYLLIDAKNGKNSIVIRIENYFENRLSKTKNWIKSNDDDEY